MNSNVVTTEAGLKQWVDNSKTRARAVVIPNKSPVGEQTGNWARDPRTLPPDKYYQPWTEQEAGEILGQPLELRQLHAQTLQEIIEKVDSHRSQSLEESLGYLRARQAAVSNLAILQQGEVAIPS